MTDIAFIRDALIDATAEAAAKIAETIGERFDPAEIGTAKFFGALIAADIRKQLLVKPDGLR